MKKCICCFAERGLDAYDAKLKREIYKNCCFLVEEKGVNEFWTGRNSKFYRMCAKTVDKVKARYGGISNVLVVPYVVQSVHDDLLEYLKIYDDIVTSPTVYNSPIKLRITMCNQYMRSSSDWMISCTSELSDAASASKKINVTVSRLKYDN